MVPWADWSEWLELKGLVSTGETEAACQRVAMYRIRRRGAVPITVLTTVALLKQLQQPVADSYLQRLALSMTLTRFVNGTTDRLQPRGEGSIARSVYSLAHELQLPLVLVEVRHQASHNVLPRLSTLTSGAKQALKWLQDFYWVPQTKNIRNGETRDLKPLRKVFGLDYGDDEESSEAMLVMEQYESVVKLTDKPVKEGESVLDSIRKATEMLQAKKRKRPEPINTELSGNHWALCTDSEAWKALPLGLIPGQEKVEYSVTAKQPGKEVGDDGYYAESGGESDDGSDVGFGNKRRRLTPDQKAFVAQKIEEYRKLVEDSKRNREQKKDSTRKRKKAKQHNLPI